MIKNWNLDEVRAEARTTILTSTQQELEWVSTALEVSRPLIPYLSIDVRPSEERPVWTFPHRCIGVVNESGQYASAAEPISDEIPTYLREFWIRALKYQIKRFIEGDDQRAQWRIFDTMQPPLAVEEDAAIPSCSTYGTDAFTKRRKLPLRVRNTHDLGSTLPIAKRLYIQAAFQDLAGSYAGVQAIKPETVFVVRSGDRTQRNVVKFDHPSAIDAEEKNAAQIKDLLGERFRYLYSGVRSVSLPGDALAMLVSEFALNGSTTADLQLSSQWSNFGPAFSTVVEKILDLMSELYANSATSAPPGQDEARLMTEAEIFREYFAHRHSFVPQVTLNKLTDLLPHLASGTDGAAMTIARMRWLSSSDTRKMPLAVELRCKADVLLLRFDGLADDDTWQQRFARIGCLHPGGDIRVHPSLQQAAKRQLDLALEMFKQATAILDNDVFRDRFGHPYPDAIAHVLAIGRQDTRHPAMRRCIHGDLKLENILADLTSPQPEAMLIDLASVRQGMPDFDFARLEASIFTHLYAKRIPRDRGLGEVVKESLGLQERVENAPSIDGDTSNDRLCRLLKSIRETKDNVVTAAMTIHPELSYPTNRHKNAHRVCLYLSYLDRAIKAASLSSTGRPTAEFLSLYAAAAYHLRMLQIQ